jgi:apolipoprotein N-acyltransferase
MTRAHAIKRALGTFLVLIGVLFAVLPKDWIEETFGIEPDAGNGLLELAFVLVPIAVGLALLVNVYLAHRRRTERASTHDA